MSKQYQGKMIGRGAFSKVYREEGSDIVTLVSCCRVKTALSDNEIGSFFPKIDYIEVYDNDYFYNIFKMEYYPKVRSLKSNLDVDQYEIYKLLRNMVLTSTPPSNQNDGYSQYYNLFEKIENEDLRDQLLEALDTISDYTSAVGFEISPRNVAAKNGKLILLDIFFCRDTVMRLRTK